MSRYTKQKIRDLRKGIQLGELITDEQEEFIKYFGIPVSTVAARELGGMTPERRILFIQSTIDRILTVMSRKKK